MKFVSEQDYKTRDAVKDAFPEAAKIRRVDGGWAVFDTLADYTTWSKQQ